MSGEVADSNRQGIGIHGGGSNPNLVPDPYADDQPLMGTQGCIRLHNGDVSDLADEMETVSEWETETFGETDKDPNLYVGTLDSLIKMSKETDKKGNPKYADLYQILRPLWDPNWFIPPGGCVPGTPYSGGAGSKGKEKI
jgi:hypothetical protein